MQNAKYLFTVLLLVTFLGTAAAQKSDKLDQKVTDKIAQYEQQVQAGNSDLSFTDAQRVEMKAILKEMFREVRAAKKEGGEPDEIKERQKAIRKAAFKKINMEVLTKEQRVARREGKKNK